MSALPSPSEKGNTYLRRVAFSSGRARLAECFCTSNLKSEILCAFAPLRKASEAMRRSIGVICVVSVPICGPNHHPFVAFPSNLRRTVVELWRTFASCCEPFQRKKIRFIARRSQPSKLSQAPVKGRQSESSAVKPGQGLYKKQFVHFYATNSKREIQSIGQIAYCSWPSALNRLERKSHD